METILYQRTRSIRFKLEPIEAEEIEKEITVIKTQDNEVWCKTAYSWLIKAMNLQIS